MLLRDHEDKDGRMVYNGVATTIKCMLIQHRLYKLKLYVLLLNEGMIYSMVASNIQHQL